jgi:hypothetical protein
MKKASTTWPEEKKKLERKMKRLAKTKSPPVVEKQLKARTKSPERKSDECSS